MKKRKVKNHRPPKNDLTGLKFGHLEVLRMAQTEKSGKRCDWRAICKCHNCGNENYDADQQAIKRGLTKSCGCDKSRYKKITGKRNKNFTGYEDIRGRFWTQLKKKALKRSIDFQIDIRYAWKKFLEQNKKCALSGVSIVFGRTDYRTETTASLDRIDSSKGYIEGNIQWVHKSVNIMKCDLPVDIFVGLCYQIGEYSCDIKANDIDELAINHFIKRGIKRKNKTNPFPDK